jgi:hypothetical protein
LTTLGVSGPAFLRKLPKQSDWGDPSDDVDLRVRNAVQAGFLKRHRTPFSFYRAASDDDLRRIALALNATTHSRTQKVDLVAFLPSELKEAGIVVDGRHTEGTTPCPLVNRLHFDLEATEAQLAQLCRSAMNSGRRAGRCTERVMKEVCFKGEQENCLAALENSTGCLAEGCAASA